MIKSKLIKGLLIKAFLISSISLTAQNYPFSLPDTVHATLNVNTQTSEKCNNKILGTNIFSFTTNTQKDFIRKMDPITIRFPHGVWANFYDWRTDGYQDDENYDNREHQAVLDVYIANNMKCGIEGLTQLNTERKNQNDGIGYDMIWTYNLNFDDNESSIARVKDRRSRGFEVIDIEIGNEHFWRTQRSSRTETPEDYLRLAKSLSKAMKEEFPDVRLSIPLSWRRSHAGYNSIIADSMNYYDAISIHKYVGSDPDIPGESDAAYSSILTARLALENDVNWVRDNYGPGKPVWLTEWGVSSGSNVHAAACLGMADVYLYMFENQDIYDRANWFSVNGVLNSFVTIVIPGRQPKYPLEKRGYLSTYEIVRDVFEDGIRFDTTMETDQLITNLGYADAVSAAAVLKDGNTTIFAINLTDKPAVLNVRFDGQKVTQDFIHEAMVFDNLSHEVLLGIDENPLSLIEPTNENIVLPPISLNKITFTENVGFNNVARNNLEVYPNPSADGLFYLSEHQEWTVYSIQGVKVLVGKGRKVDLSGFSNGLYILKTNHAVLKLLKN